MQKPEANEEDSLYVPDASLERETAMTVFLRAFEGLAAYYKFEPIIVPIVEEARWSIPLGRAGIFDEMSPVIVKTRKGVEFMLPFSGVLSALRRYGAYKLYDLPRPVKCSFAGERFFTPPDAATSDEAMARRIEWGLVTLGNDGPVAEAEIIQVLVKAFEETGTVRVASELHINATGCGSCRATFRSQLGSYLRGRSARLCRACKRALKHAPTEIFRCAEERCRQIAAAAPQILNQLCEPCRKHFRGVLEFLDESGISYFLDGGLFRDGSWYNRLVFEFRSRRVPLTEPPASEPDRPVVFAEGGRVSKVGKLICGKRIDGVGAMLFPEAVLERSSVEAVGGDHPAKKVFLVQLGILAKRKSLGMLEVLRVNGIPVEECLGRDSIRTQFRLAERCGAHIALVMGQREALSHTVIVREVSSGIQETIGQERIVEFLKKKLEA